MVDNLVDQTMKTSVSFSGGQVAETKGRKKKVASRINKQFGFLCWDPNEANHDTLVLIHIETPQLN